MLTRENFVEAAHTLYRLRHSPKFQVSRSLRRALKHYYVLSVSNPNQAEVFQNFAYDHGFNKVQLETLQKFAEKTSEENLERFAQVQKEEGWPATVAVGEVIYDYWTGSVSGHYMFPFNPETATLRQLQMMVSALQIIAESMTPTRRLNAEVLFDCPTYEYRNLPASIADDDDLWCVCGTDAMGGSGVLEWCYDELHAQCVLSEMQAFPERFTDLKASAFKDCANPAFA